MPRTAFMKTLRDRTDLFSLQDQPLGVGEIIFAAQKGCSTEHNTNITPVPNRTCLFFLQTVTVNFPSAVCCISCGVSSRVRFPFPMIPAPLSPAPAPPPASSPPTAAGPNTAPTRVRPRLPQFQDPLRVLGDAPAVELEELAPAAWAAPDADEDAAAAAPAPAPAAPTPAAAAPPGAAAAAGAGDGLLTEGLSPPVFLPLALLLPPPPPLPPPPRLPRLPLPRR